MGRNSYNVKLKFNLTDEEREMMRQMQRKGVVSARVIRRARILELFDRGWTSPKIAEAVGCTAETARAIGWKYRKGGVAEALFEKSRPGKKRALTTKESQKIIALVCTDPPAGRARWTIELVVDEAKRRGIVKTVGRETIRVLLHSHDLKPWREKNVVHPGTE
jgi:putative transposase